MDHGRGTSFKRACAHLRFGILSSDNPAANTISETVSTFFCLSVVVLSLAGVIVCVQRFYKSLFTGEGYMTFSLPVTPTQLLVSKFLSSLIATISCYAVILLSMLIANHSGSLGIPLWDGLPGLWDFLMLYPLEATELIFLFLGLIPAFLLFLFLMASIGQLFTKGRVGVTIGLVYVCSFLITIVLAVVIVSIFEMTEISEYLLIGIFIAIVYAFDAGSFFLVRYILMHKVNLVI